MRTNRFGRRSRLLLVAALVMALIFGAAACGDDKKDASTGSTTGTAADGTASLATAETVRLGYFPNVTHAPAIVGVEKGFFQTALGDTKLETAHLLLALLRDPEAHAVKLLTGLGVGTREIERAVDDRRAAAVR